MNKYVHKTNWKEFHGNICVKIKVCSNKTMFPIYMLILSSFSRRWGGEVYFHTFVCVPLKSILEFHNHELINDLSPIV